MLSQTIGRVWVYMEVLSLYKLICEDCLTGFPVYNNVIYLSYPILCQFDCIHGAEILLYRAYIVSYHALILLYHLSCKMYN